MIVEFLAIVNFKGHFMRSCWEEKSNLLLNSNPLDGSIV